MINRNSEKLLSQTSRSLNHYAVQHSAVMTIGTEHRVVATFRRPDVLFVDSTPIICTFHFHDKRLNYMCLCLYKERMIIN